MLMKIYFNSIEFSDCESSFKLYRKISEFFEMNDHIQNSKSRIYASKVKLIS